MKCSSCDQAFDVPVDGYKHSRCVACLTHKHSVLSCSVCKHMAEASRMALWAIQHFLKKDGALLSADDAMMALDETLISRLSSWVKLSSKEQKEPKESSDFAQKFDALAGTVTTLVQTVQSLQKGAEAEPRRAPAAAAATVSVPPPELVPHQEVVLDGPADSPLEVQPWHEDDEYWPSNEQEEDLEEEPIDLEGSRKSKILEASRRVLKDLGLECKSQVKEDEAKGFVGDEERVQLAFPIHDSLVKMNSQLCARKTNPLAKFKGKSLGYRLQREHYAMLGVPRRPDLVLRERVPHKMVKDAKGDVSNVELVDKAAANHDSSLKKLEEPVGAMFRIGNTLVHTMANISSIMKDAEKAFPGVKPVQDLLEALSVSVDLAKSAAWDVSETALKTLGSLERDRREVWLDKARLPKDVIQFAKFRPLPLGSVSEDGQILMPSMCGEDLSKYVKDSAQVKKNLDKACPLQGQKRPYSGQPSFPKRGRFENRGRSSFQQQPRQSFRAKESSRPSEPVRFREQDKAGKDSFRGRDSFFPKGKGTRGGSRGRPYKKF